MRTREGIVQIAQFEYLRYRVLGYRVQIVQFQCQFAYLRYWGIVYKLHNLHICGMYSGMYRGIVYKLKKSPKITIVKIAFYYKVPGKGMRKSTIVPKILPVHEKLC